MYINEKQPDDSQAISISINKLIEGASFIKRCLLCKGFKYVLTILQFSGENHKTNDRHEFCSKTVLKIVC